MNIRIPVGMHLSVETTANIVGVRIPLGMHLSVETTANIIGVRIPAGMHLSVGTTANIVGFRIPVGMHLSVGMPPIGNTIIGRISLKMFLSIKNDNFFSFFLPSGIADGRTIFLQLKHNLQCTAV